MSGRRWNRRKVSWTDLKWIANCGWPHRDEGRDGPMTPTLGRCGRARHRGLHHAGRQLEGGGILARVAGIGKRSATRPKCFRRRLRRGADVVRRWGWAPRRCCWTRLCLWHGGGGRCGIERASKFSAPTSSHPSCWVAQHSQVDLSYVTTRPGFRVDLNLKPAHPAHIVAEIHLIAHQLGAVDHR
jgi:hypothetical protein